MVAKSIKRAARSHCAEGQRMAWRAGVHTSSGMSTKQVGENARKMAGVVDMDKEAGVGSV